MTHALTSDAGLGNLNSALIADNALETDLLVLSAVAFPILAGSEDLLG